MGKKNKVLILFQMKANYTTEKKLHKMKHSYPRGNFEVSSLCVCVWM